MNIDHYDFDNEMNKDKCLSARYYVTATDKLFNGCPLWPGKIAKLVVACDTYEQSAQVVEGMKYKKGNRGYFSYVKIIRGDMPNYANSRYAVKVMHYDHATAFH